MRRIGSCGVRSTLRFVCPRPGHKLQEPRIALPDPLFGILAIDQRSPVLNGDLCRVLHGLRSGDHPLRARARRDALELRHPAFAGRVSHQQATKGRKALSPHVRSVIPSVDDLLVGPAVPVVVPEQGWPPSDESWDEHDGERPAVPPLLDPAFLPVSQRVDRSRDPDVTRADLVDGTVEPLHLDLVGPHGLGKRRVEHHHAPRARPLLLAPRDIFPFESVPVPLGPAPVAVPLLGVAPVVSVSPQVFLRSSFLELDPSKVGGGQAGPLLRPLRIGGRSEGAEEHRQRRDHDPARRHHRHRSPPSCRFLATPDCIAPNSPDTGARDT